MPKSTLLKLCLYITILFAIAYVLPASAQPAQSPISQELLRCGNDSVSRYEAWVKDLPCNAAQSQTNLSNPKSVEENSQSAPDWTPSPLEYTYLVFSSYRDGNWEVYGSTAPWNEDTLQDVVRMTSDSSSDIRPRLRPGSTQIAFSSDRTGNYEVYLMDWGGGNVQQLTWSEGYDSQPAWSPDGSKLALVDELDGNLEIAVMNADGSNWTRLTYDMSDDFNPSWSPDGTKLVWVKAYDANYSTIYTMNVDGSNQQAITGPLLYAQHPSWSGDGSLIAFDYDMNLDNYNDLVWMNTDGSNATLVKGGTYMVDYYAGSWTGLEDDGLLFTQIEYVEYKGQLYITEMCNGAISLIFNDGHCYYYSDLDMYPDASSQDVSVPETHILSLPKYSRSGDIQLTTVGYDPGVAGIYSVHLEQSDMGGSSWFDLDGWLYELPHATLWKNVPANNTFIFRSWSMDLAGHREPYPSTGYDTFTNVYAWQLFGKVSDIRDLSLPKANVVTDPVFSDQQAANLEGEFHRYVPDTLVNLTVTSNGYGTLPDTSFWSQEDLQISWVLPPEDDLIQNGNFESEMTGWTNSGDFDAHNYVPGHSGGNSAILGTSQKAEGEDIPQTFSTSISQVVSISSGMNHPTLSFYELSYQNSNQGEFTVQVNDTAVYTATAIPASWEHIWVDLTDWQGQTVTVTFTVKNESYQTPLLVNLDEIFLGSWATPIITDVTPGDLEAWVSAIITVTGENFIDESVVRIGETMYSSVTFIDENTLRVEIPGGMAAGNYMVWVITPGEQYGLWRGSLSVGDLQFLPCLQK